MSQQWGIFGKSFDDIKNRFLAFKTSLNKDNKDLISNISNAWKNSSIDDIKKKIIVTSSDIVEKLLKVDDIFPEIDESKANEYLKLIQEIEAGNNKEYKSFQELYNTGNKQNQVIAKYAESTKGQIRNTEGIISANEIARESTVKYNNELKNLTIGAKAASIGIKALSLAGNMIVMALISKGIELAVQAIDDYIHRIENIKKAAEEAKSSINDIRDDFKSQSDTVNEVKDRYAELAQSVENLGKANQSRGKLSNDDYAEFLDLSNQLAESFPQLTKGYDDNGNAILNLSGNVNTIVGSLENLLKVQQKLAQQEILDKMPEVWDGYQVELDEYNKELGEAQRGVDGFESAVSKLDYGQVKIKEKDASNSIIKKALKDALDIDWWNDGKLYQSTGHGKNKGKGTITWDFSTLNEEEFEKLKAKIGELGAEYADEVQLVKDKISASNSDMSSYISTWLSQDFQFTNLQKESPDLANGISEFLMNGDWAANLPQEAGTTWEDVSKWINNQFLYAIRQAQDNPDIANAITEVFSNQDLTPEEKLGYLNQIADYFGEDNAITIMLKPEIENAEDLKQSYEDTINRFVQFGNDVDGSQKIKDFFDTEGINTDEEINEFNEVTKGINDADKAIQTWNEHKKEANETPISKSFKQAWKDLDNADDDSGMKDTKKDLTTLAESGKLTRKTFEATEGAKTWLSQIRIDADIAIKKINDLVDNSKQLNSLKSSIKSIQDAYADKRDNGVAGADTLSSMESEFGKLKSWNEFKNTLGSTTSALTDCQEAQNKLATEYVNSNNFLSQLTEENKDYYTSQLKDLGIKNAQEVVTTQLENKAKSLNLAYSALSTEQKKTVKSGEELAEMSGTDIAMLLGEADGSKKARIELAKLAYQTTNWADLDATQTIEQLNKIAEAAGIAANNISLLQDVNNNPSKYQGSSLEAAARANGMTVDEYSKQMATDQVGNKLNKKGKKTRAKVSVDLSLPKASSSSSSSDSSSSSKVFDWIEVRLKRLEDKVKKTVDKINDYASKKTKNGLFKQAKKQYDDLLHGYEIAAKKYKKKLDSINLSSDLKKKIQSGDYSIQTIKESAKKGKSKKSQKSVLNAIDSYQEYWDKYTSARDNITETKQNKRELIKKQLEDDISDLEDDLDLLQYEADKTQSRIDKNETKGFAATKNDYKEEISNSKKQISKWNQEKKAYQAYLKDNKIASSSDEYQDIQKKIRDIDKNISDAEKNQLEWNKSISELPYQNLEKFKNVLDAISSRYEKIISFWESQGHTKNESQITKQISIGLNELSQLKKERDEKWNQINKTLSDKGLNSFQKMQFKALYEGMREGTITVDQFYKSISKIGISKETFDSWDGLQDKLQEVDGLDGDILDKQAEIENNYDDLLTPWIDSIQDLIDKINDLNDAQSKAIELEKLQQALQSAKQNKKNLIYHEDYGFNYEADNSAVKEAQDNLDDYYNQEQLDTLNKILDWLNDHKDDMNFFDENGKPLYKTVDEAVKAVTKGMTEGMSESVKKMFDSLTFSIDKNGKITASVPKYATGTKYAKGGMSIVGDGGAELRLLNSGDQILPHDITDNLWKFGVNPTKMILDNIQIPDISNLVKNTGGEMVNNNVSIGTVTLPNINDLSKANDVFNALANLSSYARQQANKR